MEFDLKEGEIVYCSVVQNIRLKLINRVVHDSGCVEWFIYDLSSGKFDMINEGFLTRDSSKYEEFKKKYPNGLPKKKSKSFIESLKQKINDMVRKLLYEKIN